MIALNSKLKHWEIILTTVIGSRLVPLHKVTYMLLYLHGTPLNWFEPTLTSGQHAVWLSNYSIFLSELWNNFSPHDPEGEPETGLENLQLHEN